MRGAVAAAAAPLSFCHYKWLQERLYPAGHMEPFMRDPGESILKIQTGSP